MEKRRSRIVSAVSAMPFGGKSWVKAHYLQGKDAAAKGNQALRDHNAEKIRQFGREHRTTALWPGALAVYHTFAAIRTGSSLEAVQASYDGAMTIALAAVAYTQNYLGRQLLETPLGDPSKGIPTPGLESYRDPVPLTSKIFVIGATVGFYATLGLPFVEQAARFAGHPM